MLDQHFHKSVSFIHSDLVTPYGHMNPAYCLAANTHYLNECWAEATIVYNELGKVYIKNTAT